MKNVMEELTEVSSIQKSMWLTQKLYPESALFNVAGYCEFDGIVNEQKIKQCLTEIMNEQEMLKTIFVEQNNTIYQMNCKQPTGIIEVIKEPNLDLQQYLDDEMKKRISYNQPYCFSIIYCNEKTIVFIGCGGGFGVCGAGVFCNKLGDTRGVECGFIWGTCLSRTAWR